MRSFQRIGCLPNGFRALGGIPSQALVNLVDQTNFGTLAAHVLFVDVTCNDLAEAILTEIVSSIAATALKVWPEWYREPKLISGFAVTIGLAAKRRLSSTGSFEKSWRAFSCYGPNRRQEKRSADIDRSSRASRCALSSSNWQRLSRLMASYLSFLIHRTVLLAKPMYMLWNGWLNPAASLRGSTTCLRMNRLSSAFCITRAS